MAPCTSVSEVWAAHPRNNPPQQPFWPRSCFYRASHSFCSALCSTLCLCGLGEPTATTELVTPVTARTPPPTP